MVQIIAKRFDQGVMSLRSITRNRLSQIVGVSRP